MMKVCKECKLEFNARRSKIKYCSIQCSGASLRKEKIEIKCRYCNNIFLTKRTNKKFCNTKCANKNRSTKISKQCLKCNKEFTTVPSQIKLGGGKYCSHKCSDESNRVEKIECTCIECNIKFYMLPGKIADGGGRYCSKLCSISAVSDKDRDDKLKDRDSSKAKTWRLSVYQRDNFTCKKCNERGGKLNAHHIYSFAKNKDLRFDINNGITLCKKCHTIFHKKYGFKNFKEENTYEFISN